MRRLRCGGRRNKNKPMSHNIGISLLAILPALALGAFIYAKDRGDKEPFSLLALLFGAGAAAYIPLYFIEKWITGGIDALFPRVHSVDGFATFSSPGAETAHHLIFAFLGVALLEECVKWGLLLLITRKNSNFNYLFDGLIYSAFISLGYAMIENVRYAWVNGWDLLPLRAVTSVPAHLFYGILMGFFYSLWHTYSSAKSLEDKLYAAGTVKTKKIRSPLPLLIFSILAPLIVHGAAEFISLGNSTAMHVVYYIFIGVLYIVCFVMVFRLSSLDKADHLLAQSIVRQKHPGITL